MWAYGRCYYCDAKHRARQERRKSKKGDTIAVKRRKALRLYSTWRRMSSADDWGMCTCVTCGKVQHWKKIQNGHYIRREVNATTFLDENNHPQCITCNEFNMGEEEKYKKFIIKEYGERVLDELHRLSHTTHKFTHEELDRLIESLENRINKEKERLKN